MAVSEVVLYMVAIALLVYLVLFRWYRVSRPLHPEHETEAEPVSVDVPGPARRAGGRTRGKEQEDYAESVLSDPPPKIYGEDIETEDGKYILLVAGSGVVERVLVDLGPMVNPPSAIPNPIFARYRVVPVTDKPSGARVHLRFSPVANMAAAWKALVAKYYSDPFRAAGWELLAMRAMDRFDLDASLGEIKRHSPKALAVHYFGHGDADYAFKGLASLTAATEPFLSIRGERWVKRTLPDPQGGSREYKVLEPDEGVVSKYYVKDLAAKLQADFPDIPLVLVLDGCEQAEGLRYRSGRLGIAVSVDHVFCGSNMGLFSALFAPHVTPRSFDDFRSAMPGVLAATNANLNRYPVAYVDTKGYRPPKRWVPRGKPKQNAALDRWRYP